jgi:hypothetical protein
MQMADENWVNPTPAPTPSEDPSRPVTVMFVNAEGAGFADNVTIPGNMTIAAFFARKFPGREAGSYMIRINNQAVRATQVLNEGDRVTVTPTKIAGA